jgi:aryl-alcohol dehydrogenase-like predicted oxidoreductase
MYAATINDGQLVNRVGLSRKHIFDAVQASVKRLGTYIDVLQIHRLDRDVPREEIMKALNDVIEKGWVRHIGASSVCPYFHCNSELKPFRVSSIAANIP